MTNSTKAKRAKRARRAHRVRARIHGTADVPRMSVFRSEKHVYVQVIDDASGRTLAAASDKGLTGKPVERAHEVGKAVAEQAKAAGISKVVFDRGSYRYHGRVAAVADGAREAGITF